MSASTDFVFFFQGDFDEKGIDEAVLTYDSVEWLAHIFKKKVHVVRIAKELRVRVILSAVYSVFVLQSAILK